MKAIELKKKYLKFFESKGHKIIPSASLIPENDPTVLFTTAGMHPLVPYLLGEKHPLGTRLTNAQKCIRTGDIDETGDSFHHTFFEMMGNWSLGDYFKKEAIKWSYEFLTSKDWLGLEPNRIAVSVFAGDSDCPFDQEAFDLWKNLGIPEDRIAKLPKKNNWWGPAGETGPCGPDTEIFYWVGNETEIPKQFNDDNNSWVEIWNNVFMEYNKEKDGSYKLLTQKNVDTGLGLERVTAVLQGFNDNYKTERFWPIILEIERMTGKKYVNFKKEMRIIADHIRSSVFILGDERHIVPSNMDQGYILRRFIRRAMRQLNTLGLDLLSIDATVEIAKIIIKEYSAEYSELKSNKNFILSELKKEEDKFQKTLKQGLKEFNRISEKMLEFGGSKISGKVAFLLFQSYGFPLEITQELALEKGMEVDVNGFHKAFEKHQELSRKGAEQKFKGGLSESSEITKRYHTATHILNKALKIVLKNNNIKQKGSNITSERMRFDFNFDRSLTEEEKKSIEEEVNKIIKLGLTVTKEEIPLEEAKESGAEAEFGTKYPEKVSVYSIGDYCKEICAGPHVKNTKELGVFKIKKEKSSAAGIRRIKAVLE